VFLLKMSKNLHMSLVALERTAHAESRSYLIRLVGTRIPTVSMMEWQLILPLKTLTRNKSSRCRLE
jgi:hypothetical protein